MLTTKQEKYVRKCCIQKGTSINSVARKTGHDWRTVKKCIEKEDYNQKVTFYLYSK